MKKKIISLAICASVSLGASQVASGESTSFDASVPFVSNQTLPFLGNAAVPLISNNTLALVSNGQQAGGRSDLPLISNGQTALLLNGYWKKEGKDPLITNELPIMSNAGSSMIENVDSGLPMLSNAGGYSVLDGVAAKEGAPLAGAHAKRRIEQLATGAAAAALVELKCNPSGFEQSARDIQRLFEAKAMVVGRGDPKAKSFAKAAGKSRFLALEKSSRGQECESLSGLRALAAIDGFERE